MIIRVNSSLVYFFILLIDLTFVFEDLSFTFEII